MTTMMTISTLMTIVFVRNLEVVHKQVGGYLTRCARIAASIALNDESSVTQSLTNVGIELLWQLKTFRVQQISCSQYAALHSLHSFDVPDRVKNSWDVSSKVCPDQNNFLIFPIHAANFTLLKEKL